MQKELITSDQIRAARALLRWSSNDLAIHSGIGVATIKRLEVMEGIPTGNMKTLISIIKAFESKGILFIGSVEDGAGVRFAPKSDSQQ